MGYQLRALIGERDVTDRATLVLGRPAVPLEQGLGLVALPPAPGTRAQRESWDGEPYLYLSDDVDRLAAALSAIAPIAYVEAHAGPAARAGSGTQAAALWSGGRLTVGPLTHEDGPAASPAHDRPINVVLRALGATRAGAHDEFEAVGLARHAQTGAEPVRQSVEGPVL